MNRINEVNKELLGEVENNQSYKDSIFYNLAYPGPATKGAVYEKLVTLLYKSMGIPVTTRTHKDHDRVINRIKTEIKGGMWTKGTESFRFNQIRFSDTSGNKKDWDQIVFLCIGPDFVYLFEDTWQGLQDKGITANQHGGENVKSGTDWFSADIEFMKANFEEI